MPSEQLRQEQGKVAKASMIRLARNAILAGCCAVGAGCVVPALGVAQTFDVKQLDINQGALELGLDNTVQGKQAARRQSRRA